MCRREDISNFWVRSEYLFKKYQKNPKYLVLFALEFL